MSNLYTNGATVSGTLSYFDSFDLIRTLDATSTEAVSLQITADGAADLSDELGAVSAAISASGDVWVQLVTGSGNDTLIMGGGQDWLDLGHGGNDLVYAGAGDDTVIGGGAGSTVFAYVRLWRRWGGRFLRRGGR